MSQSNFPFVGGTKKPQAASAFAMRSITTEVQAINYDVQRSGLKQYYIAACMGVHETLVSKWCKGNKPFPSKTDKRLERFCAITGSTALKQLRQRLADEKADALIETPAQFAKRLVAMERAA
jgi:DNA-binding transcriptional regulator YdaS (Cro superfamily)